MVGSERNNYEIKWEKVVQVGNVTVILQSPLLPPEEQRRREELARISMLLLAEEAVGRRQMSEDNIASEAREAG